MSESFVERLREAFGFATMAEIARRIGVPHATVRNYFGGRLPAPDVLIKIANETNISLNWLLTGKGEMFLDPGASLDLGKLIDRKIDQIIERKLAGNVPAPVQDLGIVDAPPEFDVEASLAKHSDPHKVMSEWFRHEKRKYPKDFGVVFFQGWETFTDQERLDAVKDAKKVLDRTLLRGQKI
ncbi:MAG: helix-turn-helix domain containing protein [Acidobacteria bacterium]|nr:helix-turn-helix domain containing protein [Acidobacteriota bacterium]